MAALEEVLREAKAMLGDVQLIKSESARAMLILQCRALETMIHGEPVTPYPRKHHGPDEGLGLGPR